MSKKLDESQIQASLSSIPKWKLEKGELVQNATFDDFKQAMTFIKHVAELAENAGHHPDIDIRYNKVKLALTSHDSGGLTERDFHLAKVVDAISTKN